MRRNKVKSWRIITTLLLCLALAGTIACTSFGGGEEEAEGQLVEVVRGDLTVIVSGSGNIAVSSEANLAFGTGGKVDKIYVEEDDRVSSGDVLAKLDTSTLELALTQAKLTLATAEYNLDKAQQIYTKPDINAARAAVSQAKAYLKYAKLMLETEAVTPEDIRIWENEVYQAEVNLAAAEQRLEEMLAGGEAAEVTLRRLEVEAARKAAEQAQKELDEATITAPFDGVVGAIYVEEGDIIPSPTMAPTVVIYLITPSSMELKAEVDEIDIPDVEVGQRAIIEVDAFPEEQFEGTVNLISPVPIIEAGLVLYEVNIGFTLPPDSKVRVGMSATADIIVQQRENALLVPERAIERDSQGNPVVWVRLDGQIEERPVVTGISDGLQTEILDGLDEGEIVAVEKQAKSEPTGMGCGLPE
jgi:RND family efflux transporter MFP subunit